MDDTLQRIHTVYKLSHRLKNTVFTDVGRFNCAYFMM